MQILVALHHYNWHNLDEQKKRNEKEKNNYKKNNNQLFEISIEINAFQTANHRIRRSAHKKQHSCDVAQQFVLSNIITWLRACVRVHVYVGGCHCVNVFVSSNVSGLEPRGEKKLIMQIQNMAAKRSCLSEKSFVYQNKYLHEHKKQKQKTSL